MFFSTTAPTAIRLIQFLRRRLQRRRTQTEQDAFVAGGQLPWSPGYEQHKTAAITAAINDPAFDPSSLPPKFGWRLDERIVEYPWCLSRLPATKGKLLDAGSTLNFPHILSHPKLKEKNVFVSTLAPEHWAAWQWGVSYIYEDLRESCFRDNFFDTVVCLSTMEHVGLDNTMLYTSEASKNERNAGSYTVFLAELRRVLKPGGRLLLSMPFGRYADHGWFQVFDGGMVDDVIREFAPTQVNESIFQYLPDGWVASSRASSKDATFFDIHKTKSYDSDYAAASRAVVCLELTK